VLNREEQSREDNKKIAVVPAGAIPGSKRFKGHEVKSFSPNQ